jgi:gluconokinase
MKAHGKQHSVYVIVMGVSGCGKSTVAREIASALGNAVFVDGDDLHPETNIRKMSRGTALDDADRWPWLDTIRARAAATLSGEQSFVVACSALKQTYRQRLCSAGVDGWFIYLNGNRELIARRQAARENHFMPPSLIASQFEALEEPVSERNVISVSIDQPVPGVVGDAMERLLSAIKHE